jgi:hypothetical protein
MRIRETGIAYEISDGNENCSAVMRNTWHFFSNSKVELPYNLVIPFLDMLKRIESKDSKRYLHTHVHSSNIHNSQMLEVTHMPTSR